MQRLGIRRTTLGALALLATGVAVATQVTQPWQLVLVWGILVGTGSGMVALVLGATVVNRWFTARRGLAMGLLTASTATGLSSSCRSSPRSSGITAGGPLRSG